MAILLDTCALLWMCCEPERFPAEAQNLFRRDQNAVLYISDATVLEIALKSALGKLELPEPPRRWIENQCNIWGIISLPITHETIYVSAELPWHHKDPFDRLIIATAQTHDLPVVTSDRLFKDYGIDVVW